MKNAIIIHGVPSEKEYYDSNIDSPSNSHWLPWLQKQLLVHDILAQTPEMPFPFLPNFEDWEKIINKFDINEETTLIGHSGGAGFLVKYLSLNKIKVKKVILVAPWINPEHDEIGSKMFESDFSFINKDLVSETKRIIIFESDNDEDYVQESVRILKENIKGLESRNFHNYGHFTLSDMGTREFPELLEETLK